MTISGKTESMIINFPYGSVGFKKIIMQTSRVEVFISSLVLVLFRVILESIKLDKFKFVMNEIREIYKHATTCER